MYVQQITPTWFKAVGKTRDGKKVIFFAFTEEVIKAKKDAHLAAIEGSAPC